MNAVPVADLPNVIEQTVKGFVNGLVRLKKKGVIIDPQDTKLDLSFTVLAPNGLNAISRVRTSQTNGQTVSVQETPEIKEITTKSRESSSTVTREGEKNSSETSVSTPNVTTTQIQDFGRTTELTVTYESP